MNNIQSIGAYEHLQQIKPYITNLMPKVEPYTGFIQSEIRKVFFVFDVKTESPIGCGESLSEAIKSAKDLYNHLESGRGIEVVLMQIKREKEEKEKSLIAESIRVNEILNRRKNKIKTKTEKKVPARALVFKKNDGKCFYCNEQLIIDEEWHIEHKQPKSRGGSNDIENLVPSCKSCNLTKKDKTAKEFLERSM